ncbi:FxLD family lanthipeptide [Streptomyces sp. NPDC002073]
MSITLDEMPVLAGIGEDDEFRPLDVRVVVATKPHGPLQCTTGDGCGSTCTNGASACNSEAEDPA